MNRINTYIVRMNGVAIAKVTAATPEDAVEMVRSALQLDAITPEVGTVEWVTPGP